jgi:protein involved in polysaccharide export with SLBB domain
MPQSSTFSGAVNVTPSHPSRLGTRGARPSQIAVFVAGSVLTLLFAGGTTAHGQTPFSSNPAQSTAQPTASADGFGASTTNAGNGAITTNGGSETSADSNNPNSSNSSTSSTNIGNLTPVSLSSSQIIDILQQNPDLVLELKSQVADRMQEQGRQIDANEISDQMLYDQIASNPGLRANITSYLRARGYVTDDDLQTAASGASGANEETGATQRALAQTGDTNTPINTSGLAAGSGLNPGLDTGQSSLDSSGLLGTTTGSTTSANQPRNPQANRNRETVNSSTDLPKVLRLPAPYNLRSMRDLYTQVPDQAAHLKRFGSEVFLNRDVVTARGVSARDTPLDIPLGPDYVLGPGDTLTIDMWGSVTVSVTRQVDRNGRVLLPEAGSVQVAGLPLEQAQSLIGNALKQQYRNAQAVVTVSRLRSVRVYVVGDVQRPGGYDISSLATPLSALYAAGGPTAAGSLRTLRHFRGKQLVEEVDLYDFLLHGIRNGSGHFESGDTLLVPPAGPEVAVYGAVKRPAIYEVKAGETSLATFLNDAGGYTVAASLGHIAIERIDSNRQRETVTLNLPGDQSPQANRAAIDAFQVQDGDRVRVEPILPYSERVVYLEGHVARPGRVPYADGMHLGDVLHSYRDILPEPSTHGEIVRLVPPDLHAETIDFDVPEVLIGNGNLSLQPFDTIRIFGRYELDAPKAKILGEVMRPGFYPLSKGMTAAQLVRMAGGFKRDALLEKADLTSYDVNNGNRIVESLATVQIGAAVTGRDPNADVPLKPGDVLTVHQITGWNDIGESITIDGQVKFPGNYGFHDGEHLSSVLRRAGGFLPAAYPMGAVLVRDQVRELEQKSREELIRQIETNSAAARLSPATAGGDGATAFKLIQAQQQEVLQDLKSHPPTGRMVIQITADIDSWANTSADIELRRGDVLMIPKRPGFVLVTGQVYNATALTFAPGQTAGWYLSHAGGTNSTANRKEVFIIRANGSVIGRRSGEWFDPKVLSTKLNPGDVVVVPQKIIGTSLLWKNLLTTAQLASSIAITASVASL